MLRRQGYTTYYGPNVHHLSTTSSYPLLGKVRVSKSAVVLVEKAAVFFLCVGMNLNSVGLVGEKRGDHHRLKATKASRA